MLGVLSYHLSSLVASLPFYDNGSNTKESFDWLDDLEIPDEATRDKHLKEYLENNATSPNSIKLILHRLDINLQHEPAYSRKIFNQLLSKSIRLGSADNALFLFLHDLTLNIRGAGNYAAAIEHLACHGARRSTWKRCLRAVVKGLELGLIPPDELRAILKTMPRIQTVTSVHRDPDLGYATRCYRNLWEAIGRCDVYSHKDLDAETVDVWLGLLDLRGLPEDLELAREIILVTRGSDSGVCSWAPTLIMEYLDSYIKTNTESCLGLVIGLLNRFTADAALNSVICVTEDLVSLDKGDQRTLLLETWQDCLLRYQVTTSLASSPVWLDIDRHEVTRLDSAMPEAAKLTSTQRIILRLWILRILSHSLSEIPRWKRRPRLTDLTIINLLNHYETLTYDEDFLTSFMTGIHDLELPSNGLLLLAVDMRNNRKSMTKPTRKLLEHLERSRVSFADLFADLHAYNSAKWHFFSKFEKMVKSVDVTHPTFIDHSLQLAKTGDSKSVWTLMRFLRSHTPLKIALSKSWHKDSDTASPGDSEVEVIAEQPDPSISSSNTSFSPDDGSTIEAEEPNASIPPPDTSSACPPSQKQRPTTPIPIPHAALELIHILAVAIASSPHLTPSRTYHLIHWLYVFLVSHNAPVNPALVRAMYHAGVVRYQREGKRVAPTRYLYIMELVSRFEEPGVAEELLAGPRFGESRNGEGVRAEFQGRG